jgi:hypothetical protein
VKDDVLARIQRALDERTNLEEDLELQRVFAVDPEAAHVASELAAIDEALRSMKEPVLSEPDLDRLVTSIEDRLDETLEPMADPTAPPALDDDDPAAADGPDGHEETRALAALGAPERVSLDSLPPELLESLPPEGPAEAPARPAPRKAIPRPQVSVRPVEPTGERFSLTSVAPPPPPLHTLPPIDDRAPSPQQKRRAGAVIALFGGTLAAAAGVVLVLFVGTMGRDEDLAYAPAREQPLEPGALQLDEARPSPAAPVSGGDQPARTLSRPEANQARGGADDDHYGLAEGGDGATGAARELRGRVQEQQARPALARDVRERLQAETHDTTTEEAEPDRDALTEPEPESPAEDPAEPPAQTVTAAAASSARPSRDDVIAAMREIAPSVASCGGGARNGVVEVRIRVGSSGRVQSSVVIGQFAATPEGSCIARAARGARFQPFSQDSFEFTYPFRLQ